MYSCVHVRSFTASIFVLCVHVTMTDLLRADACFDDSPHLYIMFLQRQASHAYIYSVKSMVHEMCFTMPALCMRTCRELEWYTVQFPEILKRV